MQVSEAQFHLIVKESIESFDTMIDISVESGGVLFNKIRTRLFATAFSDIRCSEIVANAPSDEADRDNATNIKVDRSSENVLARGFAYLARLIRKGHATTPHVHIGDSLSLAVVRLYEDNLEKISVLDASGCPRGFIYRSQIEALGRGS